MGTAGREKKAATYLGRIKWPLGEGDNKLGRAKYVLCFSPSIWESNERCTSSCGVGNRLCGAIDWLWSLPIMHPSTTFVNNSLNYAIASHPCSIQ